MSSRTRGKRAAEPVLVPEASTSRSSRGAANKRGKAQAQAQPEPEAEEEVTLGDEEALALGEEAEDEDLTEEEYEEPTPSKARKGKGRAKASGRGRGRGKVETRLDEEDEEVDAKPSRRLRKSVSYKEVPVEEPEEHDGEEEEEDAEGEDEDAEDEIKPRKRQPPVRLSSQLSNSTPRKRSRPSIKATPSVNAVPAGGDDDDEEDRTDTPYKFEKIPGGSGRGGFSVKGAAAAAARARWDKVRREKIERGEDPDEPRSSARKPKRRREPLVPDADHVEMGSTMNIKGQEYTVGDDELVLDEDEKGNTKVDAEGRLQGGREYKLVTFTSPTRRNPERLYTMTIDAARACGYTDSLAFLRRCPQILKLSCTADERQLLIDIGRIAGNLKHRQVTMVSVRNVFKLMGARVIKGGKWVTDDYYETEALERCKEMEIEPGTLAENEEINSRENQMIKDLGLGDTTGLGGNTSAGRYTYSLTPFYTIGGHTTTFGGNGSDPFTDAGSGNKRQKLKSAGVNDENWIWMSSRDSAVVNQQLREYRDERLRVLEGKDLEGNWVFGNEAQEEEVGVVGKTLAPPLDRRRSGLSRDVTRELTQQVDEDVMMESQGIEESIPEEKSDIVVRDPREVDPKYHWGLGSWRRGVVKAVFEPHTHIPHVPQYTQPTSSSPYDRISYHPIISSSSTSTHNSVQSTLSGPAARGISSVEYVLENTHDYAQEIAERERQVREAEDWEREMRRKRKGVSVGVS
ncbi:hypothetical protein I302_106030 [Kwoniella bestiolae CBS 10118]|uniref:Chromatin structure-remodeling complex protein RSC7 n=1 Tax=Kwoniella bestiolae CBS 10118 TaxID=1296100 RepID=A0A1B9G2V7_9TREE|nr:hypothetical protein I302_05154 [Kwoniella bestiolae CBS 10118]OCF25338.1 hypothetical protein I302_05154 [Kwoniella bestiolae CBS 10118]